MVLGAEVEGGAGLLEGRAPATALDRRLVSQVAHIAVAQKSMCTSSGVPMRVLKSLIVRASDRCLLSLAEVPMSRPLGTS